MKPFLLLLSVCFSIVSVPLSAAVRINGIGFDYATIQAAVNAADNGDRLHVSTGLYVENITITNKQLFIDGGYYLDYINKTNNPTLTVIDGSSLIRNSIRLVSNAVISLDLLSVSGGNGGFLGLGGGVQIGNGCVLSTSYTFVFNNTAFIGGGIGLFGDGKLYAGEGSFITQNRAGIGGGIATFSSNTTVTLQGPQCVCLGNYASSGGGVFMFGGRYRQKNGTMVLANMASLAGGGIYLAENADGLILGPEAFVGGMGFGANFVTNGNGAGIFMQNASLVLSGEVCRVAGNISAFNGGGMYMTNSSLTVINGPEIGSPGAINGANDSGGGIYALSSQIDLLGCHIGWNGALTNGGGIYARNSTVTINDSTIGTTGLLYSCFAGIGGGLYADSSELHCNQSRIIGCQARVGGGIALIVTGACSLTDCELSRNVATNGGALASAWFGTLVLDHTAVVSNHARTSVGGLYCVYPAPVLIKNDSRINFNTAVHSMGAIFAQLPSPLTILNSEIAHNESGGPIGAIAQIGGTIECVDTHIIDNHAGTLFPASAFAGAVYCVNGSFSLRAENRDCRLSDNSSEAGGGIYAIGNALVDISAAPPFSFLVGYNESVLDGGAIWAAYSSTVTISGPVMFEYNHARNGGAICVTNASAVSMMPVGGLAPTLIGNTAGKSGGALYGFGPAVSFTLRDVVLDGNKSLGLGGLDDGGGAAAVFNYSQLNAVNCSFVNNTASNLGGAVYSLASSDITIKSDFAGITPGTLPPSRFINNRSLGAFAGSVMQYILGNCSISETLFMSNQAAVAAGNVYVAFSTASFVNILAVHNSAPGMGDAFTFQSSFDTELLNCTIADNGDTGVYVIGSANLPLLQNCILWGQTDLQITSNAVLQFCDVQNGFSGAFNITNDPLFADVALNDYQILNGSPCIDAGATLVSVTNDCIGAIRPYDGGWDIGAYEFIPEPSALLFIIIPLLLFSRSRR